MGSYINVIEELRNRLTTAQGTGKKLVSVKKVLVGKRELVNFGESAPAIFIDLKGVEDSFDSGMRQKKRSKISVDIILIYQVFDQDNTNLYYAGYGGTTSGLLDLIEKLNDVLFENTSQALAPNLGLNSIETIKTEQTSLEKTNDGFFVYTIPLVLSTANYVMNAANS